MELGKLSLRYGLVKRVVYGGPYIDRPKHMSGICVAAELRKYPAAMRVPIPDYKIPSRPDAISHALRFALDRLAEDMPVYVGCFGGKGRTGLFLAILAKIMGYRQPVAYVRANYHPHAVETSEQEAYVECFDVKPFRQAVRKAKWKALRHSVLVFVGIKPQY